jgi:trehalose-phosphatase
LDRDGGYSTFNIPEASRRALEDAGRIISSNGLEKHREAKPLSQAVHWRGLSSGQAARVETTVRSLWEQYQNTGVLQLHEFDGGLELRVPGRTKGNVVHSVLEEYGPDAAYAYFGDDYTDEDAFEALGNRGLRVLVRQNQRESYADIRIEPPDEFLEFLQRWRRTNNT